MTGARDCADAVETVTLVSKMFVTSISVKLENSVRKFCNRAVFNSPFHG